MIARLLLRAAASIVASSFLFLSVFEASLAVETPIAGKAYSDVADDNDTVVMLRCASVVASILWLFAAVIFIHHSGLFDCGLSSDISTLTAWGISVGWSVCSVLYIAPSTTGKWTIYHPYPVTLLLAATCILVTYSGHPEIFEEEEEEREDQPLITVSSTVERQKEIREPLLKADVAVQVV